MAPAMMAVLTIISHHMAILAIPTSTFYVGIMFLVSKAGTIPADSLNRKGSQLNVAMKSFWREGQLLGDHKSLAHQEASCFENIRRPHFLILLECHLVLVFYGSQCKCFRNFWKKNDKPVRVISSSIPSVSTKLFIRGSLRPFLSLPGKAA